MEPRHILLTGGMGQVGMELRRLSWRSDVVLHAPNRSALDLASESSIKDYLRTQDWSLIINCGAWTAVDQAEEHRGAAFAINAQAPAWLAESARSHQAPIIQLSTDYVFSGSSDLPYAEESPVGPLGVYGASKLAGELAVSACADHFFILRTAWVISANRSNFLKTMLRLGREREVVSVVADQFGNPTAAADIAAVVRTVALRMLDDAEAPSGIYHFVNSGESSWHGLAAEIFAAAGQHWQSVPTLRAIKTDEFPTLARRPMNSRLATAKISRDYSITPRDWRLAVAEIIEDLVIRNSGKGAQL